MLVTKWNDSLAVRIPADVARDLGIEEGDSIELVELADGTVALATPEQRRAAALARIRTLARPFPADFKFDRDEANAR